MFGLVKGLKTDIKEVEGGRCMRGSDGEGVKVNLGKSKVIVSSSITKDGLSKRNDDPCVICCLRVRAISVFYVQCGKWIHGRCCGLKMVTARFRRHVVRWNGEGNIGEAVEQVKKNCDEVATVKEFA